MGYRGEGTGISALLNEIKLNDIIGLYEKLGGVNFQRVLIKKKFLFFFFSQDWPDRLKKHQ